MLCPYGPSRPITLPGNPTTLAKSLDSMLHPSGLDWYVSDEGIVVTTKKAKVAAHKSVDA